MDVKPYDFGAEKLKATPEPMFFIHGDADGVRLDHIAEMFRLKGDEIMGDMRPRSASRLAILPDTTHVNADAEDRDARSDDQRLSECQARRRSLPEIVRPE